MGSLGNFRKSRNVGGYIRKRIHRNRSEHGEHQAHEFVIFAASEISAEQVPALACEDEPKIVHPGDLHLLAHHHHHG